VAETAKQLLVRLFHGDDVATLHFEDRQAVESIVDQIDAAGWRLVRADQIALQGHIDHGELIGERDLLKDALTHVLAAARDVDRNMRDVHTERCDDCDQLPSEGHDDDCGMDPLASACDYAIALLRGHVTFDVTPTSVGGTDG